MSEIEKPVAHSDGDGIADGDGTASKHHPGIVNIYTVLVCLVASSGAILFGYDLGVTGGVLGMPSFLEKFFPSVAEAQANSTQTAYCKYDSQIISLYTSSLFLSGMVGSAAASYVTTHRGRKGSMVAGALFYILGAGLCCGAVNTAMLVCGRLVLGLGVGFANQVVPLYLAEIPPARVRGSLQIMFQLLTNIGILVAGLVNYGTAKIPPDGWRISLGVVVVPATILLIGGLLLPESPNSLAERGKTEEARRVLRKLRGSDDIEAELESIIEDCRVAAAAAAPWKTLFTRPYAGEATVAMSIAFFSQFTGINSVVYYTPQLFSSLGSSDSQALLNAVFVAAVLAGGCIVSIFLVDRVGRRPLLVIGGLSMMVFQIANGIILKEEFSSTNVLTGAGQDAVLAMVLLFTFSFGFTWGPLGWLVPVEVQSLATRSTAQSMTVIVNFLAVFITTQSFLPMLCTMEWGIFLFFAAFDLIMSVFAYFLVPETRHVPIDKVRGIWYKHRFWKRYAGEGDDVQECMMPKRL